MADIIAWDQNKWAVCQNLLVPLPNEYNLYNIRKIKKNILLKNIILIGVILLGTEISSLK